MFGLMLNWMMSMFISVGTGALTFPWIGGPYLRLIWGLSVLAEF
jgi:hypothetical protein